MRSISKTESREERSTLALLSLYQEYNIPGDVRIDDATRGTKPAPLNVEKSRILHRKR